MKTGEPDIKQVAKETWAAIKAVPRVYVTVIDFSPQSLWVVDGFLEFCNEKDSNKISTFMDTWDTKIIQFKLGSYIGEVVRKYYGDKCKWGEQVQENEIELELPDRPPLFPMKFIEEQLFAFKSGNIAKWGIAAGLPVGSRPRRPIAKFGR